MGNRLVQIIRYNGKFLAASYEHWSASEAVKHEDALDDAILAYDLFKDEESATPELAVKCLIESIKKAQGGSPGLDSPDWFSNDTKKHSYKQELFIKEHPEFPLYIDRNEGLITVDEEVADDWEGWAEDLNVFDWS